MVLLLAFGVAGYMIIEGWSFLDALYMTVISVTTVGYDEVAPLSNSGRIFTIFVILFGVGTALYILTILVQTVVEGELAEALGVRRMKARIDALSDAEVQRIAGRIDELPAGGDFFSVVLIAALVVLILLLTDYLGITNLFPGIEPREEPIRL